MPIRTDIPELNHWRVISDPEIEQLRDAVLSILDSTGFRICSREILERLEKRGLRVDYATMAVRPTPAQMAAVEENARRHAIASLEDATRQRAIQAGGSTLLRAPLPGPESVGHNYTLYYDYTEGVRRGATLDDIRNVVKAWQMMPDIGETGPCMTAQDAPPPIEPILSTVETMRLTDKIRRCPELILPEQLPYLEELETIMSGETVTYHTNGCSVNHFTMDERACGCLLAVAKNGLENWWTNSCPVAGANAPVTLAGATVVGIAEQMGAWLAGWAMNEEVALSAIPLAGIFDMRTGRVLFSTPETILVDCAMYQFFYRLYGLRIGLCAGYTDAKVPGVQAINDKMLKALAYGWYIDQVGGQCGTLEAGNAYSPTQQVIDLELNRQIAQLTKGMEVSAEQMAVAEIEQYARDERGSFLLMDHTLDHWRDVLWFPKLMDRTAWTTPEEERRKEMQIVESAEHRWRDALRRYQRPDLDDEKIRAAEDVLAAARELLA
jgi:trimethylamine:corrinoid methyltransferase-like protein